MLRILAALFMICTTGAQAQSCGPAQVPCTLPDGIYHAALPQGEAVGIVVFLHGYGGRAAGIIRNTGLIENFTSRGYAVIAVQGRPRFEGDRGGSWNSLPRGAPRRDDVAFITAATDDAAARFDLPRDGAILAGFSGGGMMTWRLACDAPDSFAAYAPIAGTFWHPIPENCAGPVRILHTHGTTDTVVPLEGRMVGSNLRQGNIFDVLTFQRQLHGCAAEDAGQSRSDARYEITVWKDCALPAEVALALHSGGHAIPQGWAAFALNWAEQDG